MRRAIVWFLLLSVLAVLIIEARAWMDRHPQDLPWTKLRLDQPIGRFSASKIAALGENAPHCRRLLADAGALDKAAPSRRVGEQCGYDDGMTLASGGARSPVFAPGGLVTSCPVAAALLLWDERVVQPSAQRHFGSAVSAILHAGSYSCRRLYNRGEGPWSEHATADAVDILGFRLADGRTVSVLRDWTGDGPSSAFLRDVRDGGCRLFTTVLSPDYNAAHRDHLHLDTGNRGAGGWRACR
jgi:hypothetical protein